MTHIRGSIINVDEISKLGYSQPDKIYKGWAKIAFIIPAGNSVYDLTVVMGSDTKSMVVKTISASVGNNGSIPQIWLEKNGVIYFISPFFIQGEWIISDTEITPSDTWTVTINNTLGGNTAATINIYWIETRVT